MRYILASASPRRKELLTKTGLDFEIIPSNIEEKITKELPSDIVMELALGKSLNVYEKLNIPIAEDCIVIGADTIVVYQNEILGKPQDSKEAYDMLSMLADRTHQVYTGVSLIIQKNCTTETHTFYEKTDVTFYPICKEDLQGLSQSLCKPSN